jgi:hypothetical protein
MRISRVATVACADIVMTVLAPIAAAGTASDDSVSKVWALENHYWEYVKNGDSEHYLTLWHKDLIGWGCAFAAPHPSGKGNVGGWVVKIGADHVRFTADVTREAAQDFGNVVVVHYITPMMFEYPDGRVINKDVGFKVTHTWMHVGDTWQIIGGMCAPLDRRFGK